MNQETPGWKETTSKGHHSRIAGAGARSDASDPPVPRNYDEPVALSVRGTHNDLVGIVVDEKYYIESLLGVGGMSAVYKAHHVHLDRTVAIKMLHKHLCADRKSVERFIREARTEDALRHPNIVSVQSVGITSDGRLFLVMDYLEGKSLADVLADDGPLSEPVARDIFVQICDALDHAHANGVVHRDLKPSNVMLLKGYPAVVKIVDFGIAKLLKAQEGVDQSLTGSGNILGTPFYMSPEQCSGKAPDGRSDIYSLGCLMYEALTGLRPFEAGSLYALMMRQIGDRPQSFDMLDTDNGISSEMERIVFQALEKLPEKRFPDASAVTSALGSIDYLSVVSVGTTARRLAATGQSPADSAVAPTGAKVSKSQSTELTTRWFVGIVVASITCCLLLGYLNRVAIHRAFIIPPLEQNLANCQARFGDGSRQVMAARLALADELWREAAQSGSSKYYQDCAESIVNHPLIYALNATREIEIIHRAYAGLPDEPDRLFQLGEYYKHAEQFEHCRQILLAVLDLQPAHPNLQAAMDIADMMIAKNEYAAAESVLSRVTGAVPTGSPKELQLMTAALYCKLADCEQHLNKQAPALQYYKRALEILPEQDDTSRLQRIAIFRHVHELVWSSGDYRAGIQALLSMIELYGRVNPPQLHESVECARLLANDYLRAGDMSHAERYYITSLSHSQVLTAAEIQDVRECLASCYFREQNFARAAKICSQLTAPGMELDPARRQRLVDMLKQCRRHPGGA